MKKIFLLIILLFQLTFVFGQTEYGNWTPSPCYNYIQFQMKYNGKSSVQSGTERVEQGSYSIRIRNTSPKKVALSYIVTMNSNREVLRHSSSTNTISTVRVEGGAPDTRLNPNEIIERDIYLTKTFQSVVYFEVWALKFESNNGATINELYENCSNGKPCMECQEHPNQMSCNSSSSTNKNTNQQTTQQNDLSEYNRSKADLERQLAEKNAEITRQNEENARLGQIWNNAVKAGVDAHNSGNYTEAKNQFTIAINNSTNETNRQNAQNYYNKSVEAEKSQAKIKMTNDLIQEGIKGVYGIADAIKANRELKEKREEEKKAMLIEYRQKKQEEKIAKEIEEKIKFEELLTQAENGNFDAQYEIAKKYGKDDEKYRGSLYFYKMAFNNPNKQLSEEFLIEYTDKLQQAGRIRDLYDILTNNEYITKYPLVKLKSAFYNIFLENYFFWPSFFEGSNGVQEGINQLKELIIQKTDELPTILYAYMQVTGDYEKFGIPLNEKEGLKSLNKTENLLANYYLGMIYLKGSSNIEKDEEKAKKYFLKCLNINLSKANKESVYYVMSRNKQNYKYSIYSPEILSYIELAKLSENEKHQDGSLIPNKIFYNLPNKYVFFIPSKELGFISNYVPNLFLKRELNIFTLGIDENDRFRLPNFPENNSIGIILVNYPLSKCYSCLEQYQTLKKINGIIFLTIQVATEFDMLEEQSNDIYYFEGGEKRTETVSGSLTSMSYSKREKISNDAVIYTNIREFEVNKLNEKGILPAIYFYKNNELKHVQTGFTDEKKINEIISKLK